MPKDFNTKYVPFAGQGIETRLPDGRLIKNARLGYDGTPEKDSNALYPFMPKCTQMLIDLPKLQLNPFEKLCAVYGATYGGYIELAAVGDPNFDTAVGTTTGATIPNRTITDADMVFDRIKYTANYLFTNVYTHMAYIDQVHGRSPYVMSAQDSSSLAGTVIQQMAQEASIKRKAVMSRIFSDCVPGEAPALIAGNTKSDGTGTLVTDDAIEIPGWAGRINKTIDAVIPELEYGDKASTNITATVALTLANEIRNVMTYGKYLSNYFVPGGFRMDKFTSPVLVMEKAVLDRLESRFIVGDLGSGAAEIPRMFNSSWKDYVTKDTGLSILTTDMFDPLPPGDEGTGKRLLCAIVEPDLFKNFVYQDDMESKRTLQPRGTVYDYQRVEALGIDVRRPSVVFTCPSVVADP